ncbi:MAG: hypothetical protein K8S62_11335 [Candidatus Sabulitectum sp.]|nr:hypothetical protein [Candidatus Sabulitectum sp.]
MNNKLLIAPVVFLLVTGCGVTDVLNFANANFRVENTTEFTICGIDISDLGSLTIPQALTIGEYWLQGECPMNFNLGLGIKNPNVGTSGLPKIAITLTSLDYDVFMDTIEGVEEDTVQVAEGLFTGEFGIGDDGEIAVLDLGIDFDGFQIFGILGVDGLIDLVLAVGGIDGDIRDENHLGRLQMFMIPTIDTPLGDMTWEEGFWVGLDWTDGS